MNTHPSFLEQYDKVTRAYFDGTLNPFNSCACFIGNILNDKGEWAWARTFDISRADRWVSIPDIRDDMHWLHTGT